jgi:hypothetical protein
MFLDLVRGGRHVCLSCALYFETGHCRTAFGFPLSNKRRPHRGLDAAHELQDNEMLG